MIKLAGFHKMKAKIKSLADVEYPNAYIASMNEIVLRTKKESMLRTPVDTGNLRASHFTRVWKSRGGKDLNGLVYNTAEYAPYVHEMTMNRHPRGGEAKFLEKALFQVAPTMVRILRRRLRHAAGGKFFTSSHTGGYAKADWKMSVKR